MFFNVAEMCCADNPLAEIKRPSPNTATIRWAPSTDDQRELNEEGVKGQLVILYDVDRASHPEQILVSPVTHHAIVTALHKQALGRVYYVESVPCITVEQRRLSGDMTHLEGEDTRIVDQSVLEPNLKHTNHNVFLAADETLQAPGRAPGAVSLLSSSLCRYVTPPMKHYLRCWKGAASTSVVNEGYFVHFFSPADLPTLRKHVTFVMDVSGSMAGRKIEQLREAMKVILDDLNEGDYFSLVIFSSDVQVRSLRYTSFLLPPQIPPIKTGHIRMNAGYNRVWDPDHELVGPQLWNSWNSWNSEVNQTEPKMRDATVVPVTPENIKKAQKFVNDLQSYY
ncbi:hypothetical protein PR048_028375, partial [Dryococelus australis]